jgi:hypothetical protein
MLKILFKREKAKEETDSGCLKTFNEREATNNPKTIDIPNNQTVILTHLRPNFFSSLTFKPNVIWVNITPEIPAKAVEATIIASKNALLSMIPFVLFFVKVYSLKNIRSTLSVNC